MMTTFTQKSFEDALGAAPATILAFADMENVAGTILKLGQKHSLPGRSGTIAAICGFTLIGLLPVRLLQQELSTELGLNERQAQELAQDIRREILAPVAREVATLQPQAEKNYAELSGGQSPPIA